MKPFQTITVTAIVFGFIGPPIGFVIVSGFPERFFDLIFAYWFGGIPALIAGVIYGGIRNFSEQLSFRWYIRAMWGACSGLIGSIIFCFFIPELFDHITLAGSLAGAFCALLLGFKNTEQPN